MLINNPAYFLLAILAIIPLFFKKKKQVGETWDGAVKAKLKIDDIELSCHHCKSDLFYKREALIVTTFISLFGFNPFNQSGVAYQCSKCGFIHWFSRSKESSIEFIREQEVEEKD